MIFNIFLQKMNELFNDNISEDIDLFDCFLSNSVFDFGKTCPMFLKDFLDFIGRIEIKR